MATQARAADRTRQQVVLVDHDLEEAKKLVAPLRGDFEFHLTISASDALELLDRQPIAAIVASQKLFSGSGLEVLTEARRRAPRTTRILLADAGDRRTLEEASASAGLFLILRRPVTAQQLRESLQDALQATAWSTKVQPEDTGEVEHVVLETTEEPPHSTDAETVPVTVLTTDADLYEAIRAALQGRHEAYLATRLRDAIAFASTGRCPVLITDQALAQPALERIARQLKTHEPALVVIAVGTREQGNALMGLLSSGAIHRFLLKPVTPGLARLAIDSAARQHHAQRSYPKTEPIAGRRVHTEPAATAPAPAIPPAVEPPAAAAKVEREPASDPAFELRPTLAPPASGTRDFGARTGRWFLKPLLLGGGVAAAALVGVLVWWWLRDSPPVVDPSQIAIRNQLAAAVKAFDAGRYVEPAGQSAADHYRKVLALDADNPEALAGLAAIADRFIDQTESAMVEGRIDEAASALEIVRQLDPDHRRLRFLDTQLRKEQQDRLLQQARESASAGNIDQAQQLLEQAARVVPAESDEVSAAQELLKARERSAQAARSLEIARQRLAQGRLVNPPDDSAKFHLRAAQAAEPGNVVVQQNLITLGQRVVAEAAQAIARNQPDAARTWIREARDLGVEEAEITRLEGMMQNAQAERSKNEWAALALRRTEENRLTEPPQDSARYYLERVRQSDPQYEGLQRIVDALGTRLLANARDAIAQRQFDQAARLISEARQIGYEGPELAAADDALRTARAPVSSPRVPQPVAPRRVHYVAPQYPRQALLEGIEGWVDVSFDVTASGDVVDARVEASSRRSLFDRAALAAVRAWKFEPREVDDPAFRQRVRTRVEFKLADNEQ